MIDKILQWAKHEKPIQAVILTGSRATDKYDELSDYDLVKTDWKGTLPELGKFWLSMDMK